MTRALPKVLLVTACCALAACAQRGADDEAVERFAATVESAQEAVAATMAELSEFEVAELVYRDYALAAAAGKGAPVPARPRTAADDARAAIDPAFEALAQYAARLSDLAGDGASAGLPPPADRLAAGAAAAARALAARANQPIADRVVSDGQAAIVSLASFAAGGAGARRDLQTVVAEMQGQVVSLDAFITAVVGPDDRSGLRSVLARAERQAASNLDHDVALILADRQETRSSKVERIQAALHARDTVPGDALLAALLRASHALVAAHAALASSASADAAVARFAASVAELGRRYERFRSE